MRLRFYQCAAKALLCAVSLSIRNYVRLCSIAAEALVIAGHELFGSLKALISIARLI